MQEEFDIGISCSSTVDADVIPEFRNGFRESRLRIRAQAKDTPRFLVSMEWVVPTAVVVYLAKPYFHTILQEAAKDHYELLKRACKRLVVRLFGDRPQERERKMSKLLSVYAETKERSAVKFLIEEGHPLTYYAESLDRAHEMLVEHYQVHPNDRLTIEMSLTRSRTPKLMAYDEISRRWGAVEPNAEAIRNRPNTKGDQ